MKTPVKIGDCLSEQDQFRMLAIVAKHIKLDYERFVVEKDTSETVAKRCYDPLHAEIQSTLADKFDAEQCKQAVMLKMTVDCAGDLLETMENAQAKGIPINLLFAQIASRLSAKLDELVVI